jgi:hypothetical protein
VDDAMQAALDDFWSLSCDDPRVRELAALADETSIAAGPCVGSTPTLSPIVLVGMHPGTIRACAHVVSADPRSGIEVGADFRAWGDPTFAVPYDAVDVEISIVGVDGPASCRRLVRGSRRMRTDTFPGPRLLLSSDEPILAVAPADRTGARRPIYVTSDAFVDGDDRVTSPGAREPMGWRHGALWIEDPGVLRYHLPGEDPASDRRLDVDPAARLRVLTMYPVGPLAALVVEPERVRFIDVPDAPAMPMRETRSFAIPAGLTDPVVFGRDIAFQSEVGIRVWNLDSGREREDLAGLDGTERIFPGPTLPTLLRAGRVLPYRASAHSFERPNWDEATAPLDPATADALGPLRGVLNLAGGPPIMLVGANGFTALSADPEIAAHTTPVFVSADMLGGSIRSAVKVWQWSMWVLVDRADGGSNLYDVSHGTPGWASPGQPCPPWDDD